MPGKIAAVPNLSRGPGPLRSEGLSVHLIVVDATAPGLQFWGLLGEQALKLKAEWWFMYFPNLRALFGSPKIRMIAHLGLYCGPPI